MTKQEITRMKWNFLNALNAELTVAEEYWGEMRKQFAPWVLQRIKAKEEVLRIEDKLEKAYTAVTMNHPEYPKYIKEH
jgi:hypothetical protein